VFRYLRGRGVRPPEAREICQEAFLRLFAALSRGESVRNARAWVFTVAHNCAVNTALSERHFTAAAPAGEIPAAAPDPEEVLLQKENLTRVHSAIGALPQQQRQFIKLRTAGFRYSEIAEITGVTVGTVAQRCACV
jgi:RNA polymerase sigma-70 factor (ECF subfamily)